MRLKNPRWGFELSPKKTVVVSFLGVLLLTGGGKIVSGHLPTYKQLAGILILFIGLSMGVEIMPEVAATLALLILVTVFLENFMEVAKAINTLLGVKGR
jgi:hypothetical protein